LSAQPVVFITGASSGIGQSLALRFHAAGYRLALVARRVDILHAWTEAQGWSAREVRVYGADVRNTAEVVAAAECCVAEMGVPNVVIANAGISIGMDSDVRSDLDVMRATFETNCLGLATTFHPFIKAMVARGGGTLVGIASVAAIRGLPGHGAYCASKSAVVAYCESLRGEMRGSGVRVVTLLPGFVDTPLTRRNPYPMPFLMTPGDFADRAYRVIAAGHAYRVIPWQMAVVAKLMRLLPIPVFDRLMAGRPRKPRRTGS
jgi:short-subunit dehydrogenase